MKECKEKGITLIALVITIIILLILAGIAIAALSGENGILIRASEAKEKTGRQEIIEKAKLEILETQTEKQQDITEEEAREIIAKYDKDYLPNIEFSFKTDYTGEEVIVTKEEFEIPIREIYQFSKYIKFFIDDKEYRAPEGITWLEWNRKDPDVYYFGDGTNEYVNEYVEGCFMSWQFYSCIYDENNVIPRWDSVLVDGRKYFEFNDPDDIGGKPDYFTYDE